MIHCSLRTGTIFKDWFIFQEVICTLLFFQEAVV